jgi:acyl-CoA synthetase (AMP-forming)/AMP-acid ligase II
MPIANKIEQEGMMQTGIYANPISAPTFWGLLKKRVAETPDAPMLVDQSGVSMSFGEYACNAAHLAAWLFEQGVRPGSRVTWQFPTTLGGTVLVAALARIGAQQNPIIHLYREHEVRQVLVQNRPEFFIVPEEAGERDFRAMAESVSKELNPAPRVIALPKVLPIGDPGILEKAPGNGDSASWVFYTSGTTAAPKGALHTDLSVITAGRGLATSYQFSNDDVGTIAYPIAHIGGPMYLSMLMISGGSALLMDRFSPADAIVLFNRYRVTVSGGSTAHYLGFLNEQARHPGKRLYPTLRILGGGGSPKPPEVYARGKLELGTTICHSYGMTECPALTLAPVTSTDEQLAYADGAPRDDLQVRIVDRDGRTVPAGSEGEIRVKGKGIFLGYTDSSLDTEAFDPEGFYRTGDLGVLREDGYLMVTGRLKDIIIRKGENVSAKEIEDLLCAHPKISDAAVIGLPDVDRGERICAVVELRHGVEALEFSEMVGYFKRVGIMQQKIPEQLEVMEKLPRNDTFNKILKNKLREQLADSPWVAHRC